MSENLDTHIEDLRIEVREARTGLNEPWYINMLKRQRIILEELKSQVDSETSKDKPEKPEQNAIDIGKFSIEFRFDGLKIPVFNFSEFYLLLEKLK